MAETSLHSVSNMAYTVRALKIEDASIVWEMLRHAAHELSLEAMQKQPYLTRYAVDWGRVGDLGYVAEMDGTAIGAVWLRLWLAADQGFGYVRDDIPELAMAVLPD